jgi:hypothetical protein
MVLSRRSWAYRTCTSLHLREPGHGLCHVAAATTHQGRLGGCCYRLGAVDGNLTELDC